MAGPPFPSANEKYANLTPFDIDSALAQAAVINGKKNSGMEMFRRVSGVGGPTGDKPSDALAPLIAMSGKYAPRLQKAMTYVATAQVGYDYFRRAQEMWRHRNRVAPEDEFLVFMDEECEMAREVMSYVVSVSTFENEQVLYLETEVDWVEDEDDDSSSYRVTKVILRPDEEIKPIEFRVDGYKVFVEKVTGKPGSSPDPERVESMNDLGKHSWDRFLVLRVRGDAAFAALRTWLEQLIKPVERGAIVPKSTLYTYLPTLGAGWTARRTSEQRSMGSVTLREGQVEKMIDDVKTFLDMEKDYVDYGIRYRRGYLLYGPPGCGKTSFVTSLARFLGIDVYYMNLQSMKSNDDLTKALDYVDPKSFVVFEDVDVVVPKRDGNAVREGVTLDHLLNVVDGMLTPHGSIFVMTTNERETLDDALLRPGRVDLELFVRHLDDDQARRMVAHFIGREVDLPTLGEREIVPAALADVFKRHLHDREAAVPEIYDLLKG